LKLKEQESSINRQTLLKNLSLLISFIILIILFLLFNRYKQHQRHKSLQERERISRDLHDQVGSSLGSIANFSELFNRDSVNLSNEEEKTILEKIKSTSRETIETMSDIVWAINPRNDNIEM